MEAQENAFQAFSLLNKWIVILDVVAGEEEEPGDRFSLQSWPWVLLFDHMLRRKCCIWAQHYSACKTCSFFLTWKSWPPLTWTPLEGRYIAIYLTACLYDMLLDSNRMLANILWFSSSLYALERVLLKAKQDKSHILKREGKLLNSLLSHKSEVHPLVYI